MAISFPSINQRVESRMKALIPQLFCIPGAKSSYLQQEKAFCLVLLTCQDSQSSHCLLTMPGLSSKLQEKRQWFLWQYALFHCSQSEQFQRARISVLVQSGTSECFTPKSSELLDGNILKQISIRDTVKNVEILKRSNLIAGGNKTGLELPGLNEELNTDIWGAWGGSYWEIRGILGRNVGISGINRGRIWVYKRLKEESGSILGEISGQRE